ncbi:MAG: RND transporter, partial [Acidimicrobiales bacterium]
MRSTDGRRRAGRLLAVILTLAVLGAGVAGGLARPHLNTTVSSFLPGGDPSVRTWKAEQQGFGSDPIAVLLTSKTPKALLSGAPMRSLIGMEGRIAKLPDVSVVYGPGTTLNEIAISLQNFLADVVGARDGLMQQAVTAAKNAGQSTAQQQAAAQAAVAQFDLHYAQLLTQGLKIGLPTVSNPTFGQTVFLGPQGTGNPAFRWLVPDVNHVAVLVRPAPNLDQAHTQALVAAVRHAVDTAGLPIRASVVTGSPVIAGAMGQEVTSELPLLAGAAVAAVLICFLITRRRRWWERLLPLLIGLVATATTMAIFGWLGVPLSLGLLAFLPIILGVGTDYPIYALRHGRPRIILVAAGASAASLAALTLSPLPYVKELGAALAVGLVLSALLGLLVARLLPAPAPAAPATTGSWARRRFPHRDRRTDRPRRGRQTWIAGLAVATVAGIAGWALLGSLGMNSDPERLASGLPALQQGVAAQQVLGASGELDVYVRGEDVLSPAFLAWFDQAERILALHHADQLRPVVSPASLLSWLGPKASPSQINLAMSLLPSYLTTSTIRDDRREAVMAFGVKLGDLGSENQLIQSIKAELPPAPKNSQVTVTGLPAVAARSYQLLSGDRWLPNIGGIAVFGVV